MVVDSAFNLVEAIRQDRLLTPHQLDELEATLLPRFGDPRALARELLNRDWLTPYQINQLLQGSRNGLVLGQYVILQRLDDTPLGQVFKARHQRMLRLAALTVVRENLLARAEAVERFYQEIQATSQLMHPHVLCAFDAGPIGRTHFFAMEHVEGIDLDRRVRQSGPLPPALAAAYVRQAALGLQHAYERGLLHHDLKPANLWETRNDASSGFIKIANLGLTMLQSRGLDAAAGPSGDSADYLAPEQAAGAPLTDVRSNLYSLGCVFYYLLVGRTPFAGHDSATKLQRHLSAEPEPIEAFRNDVPGAVLDVLAKLLAKRPEDRHATPAEAAQDIAALPIVNHLLSDSGTTTLRGSSEKTLRHTAVRPRLARRKWLMGAAVGLTVLTVGVVTAALLTRPTAPTASTPTASTPLVRSYCYQKRPTREASLLATLKASGFPTLEGPWYFIGPFDNSNGKGFDTAYPPETEIDLAKTYPGKGGETVGWREFKDFRLGQVIDLKRFRDNEHVVVYLYHPMHSTRIESLPISLGSDDTLTVWANGQKLLAENVTRGCSPDQSRTEIPLQEGKNHLLLKICQGQGQWGVYLQPLWPSRLESMFGPSLRRDFPP